MPGRALRFQSNRPKPSIRDDLLRTRPWWRGLSYIPLDGRPHLPSEIRQWLGNAVGHWEDETLIVDTTNFTSQTSFRGSRENLHLVERFTRTSSDQMQYQVTVQDPTRFSAPWTLEMSLRKASDKQNRIYETACHEGNYSMTFTLTGARAAERRAAAELTNR